MLVGLNRTSRLFVFLFASECWLEQVLTPVSDCLLYLSEALAIGCELWRGWGLCPRGVDTAVWVWVVGPEVLEEALAAG